MDIRSFKKQFQKIDDENNFGPEWDEKGCQEIFLALKNLVKSIERTSVKLDLTMAKEALKNYEAENG